MEGLNISPTNILRSNYKVYKTIEDELSPVYHNLDGIIKIPYSKL